MKRLRILQVVPSYLPATRYGGPIYSVHSLCKALATRGADVHVYTTNVDGPGVSPVRLGEPVNLDGVTVWYFPCGLGRRLYRSPAMGAALEENMSSFDVVHLHSVFLWPTTAAAAVASRRRVPYIISPRGMLVESLIRAKSRIAKSAWIQLFERRNIESAACIHFTAELELLEFNRLGLIARKSCVIPNGMDMPADAEAGYGISSGSAPRARILSLGRVNWKKGLDRLIDAMKWVPDAELLIAGNDEEGYQALLESRARECGVVDKIRFVGPVYGADKWALIRSCDLFAMPSYSENFGNAALEAMACGRPVVVTREVGLAEVISDSGAGLVTEGDPEILGLNIANLLKDLPLREHMGRAGKATVETRFAWNSIAEQMDLLYRGCIAKRRGVAASPREG